jgi:hypothetical protein
MKRRSTNVSAPLSTDELNVLAKFATNAIVEPTTPIERVNTARTAQALVRRGLLQKPKTGAMLVTPEGLAALLDTVPVQRITPPSPQSDASTRLSKALRT